MLLSTLSQLLVVETMQNLQFISNANFPHQFLNGLCQALKQCMTTIIIVLELFFVGQVIISVGKVLKKWQGIKELISTNFNHTAHR